MTDNTPHSQEATVARDVEGLAVDGARAERGWESARVRRARGSMERRVARAVDGVVRDPWPALVREALQGRARLAFTFAGQGAPWLEELRAIVTSSPRARAFVELLAAHLDDEVARLPLADAASLDDGVPLLAWLAGAAPPEATLSRAAVSAPCLFITQLARAEALLDGGLLPLLASRAVVAVAGHSQGALAAACFSELWDERDVAVRAERARAYASHFPHQGLRMEQGPRVVVAPDVRARAEKEGAGAPTPMAALSGIREGELAEVIERLGLDVAIAVENAPFHQTVSGQPAALEALRRALAQLEKERTQARAKGRFAGRVVRARWQYLTVSGPFHHASMRGALDRLLDDISRMGFAVERERLRLPLVDARTGAPLTPRSGLAASLASSVLVERTSWRKAVKGLVELGATHVVDLGPGEGVANVTSSALRGSGVRVLACARAAERAELVDARRAPSSPLAWRSLAPSLVELPSGERLVDNRFTRATGRPPVILPGMTPTTVDAPIVVAAANAGYVAELAGGGQVTEQILRTRLDEIARELSPGNGIVFNALYLDPYLWGLHFAKERLVFRLKGEGYPIVGVTVSAGVPPLDEAVALLRELAAAGMTYNALKPGNDRQLDEVLAIADAVPELDLFLHLEGGRAGGHHSWEDLDDLLVRHYASIRARDNVVLCVGGGIATEEQASAYLTGAWSATLGLSPMPVDAVLLGTRLMACREACTSPAVKEALARAPGSEAWPLDGQAAGEVTSGRSQLDASIYYLDNDAARAGRLLDEVAGDAAKVRARREQIIAALSSTAKPYFGDLEEMSYGEMLARLVELSAIGRGGAYDDGPWPDASYRRRFEELFRRAEERLTCGGGTRSLLDEGGDHEPFSLVERFRATYVERPHARMHPDDVRFFVEVCKRPGKPVCFVPVIDADVRRWFKADSLWQAHDPRYPSHAVLTIPGPRALAGIRRVDEPVAEVLGGFVRHLVERLAAGRALNARYDIRAAIDTGAAGGALVATAEERARPLAWFKRLASLGRGPLAAALREADAVVVDGARPRLAPSPLRALLAPAEGVSFGFSLDAAGRLEEVRALDARGAPSARVRLGERGALQAELLVGGAALDLAVSFVDDAPAGWLRWERARYLEGQRAFYGRLLFGAEVEAVEPFAEALEPARLDEGQLRAFRAATRDDTAGTTPSLAFPLAWRAVFRALSGARADVLKLVHEDDETEVGEAWPPRPGEELEVRARVVELEHLANGRRVVTRAQLGSARGPLAVVTSRFFIRDTVEVTPGYVVRRVPEVRIVRVRDAAEATFLAAQPWWRASEPLVFGDRLRVAFERVEEGGRFAARGAAFRGSERVALVELPLTEAGLAAHPVVEALRLLEDQAAKAREASGEVGAKSIAAPRRMDAYAGASGDLNPLHTHDSVARFAGFDAPIVHGMWTASAALHRAVHLAAGGDAAKVRRTHARFTSPVSRGEGLRVVVRSARVQRGERTLDVEVLAGADERPALRGEVVLAAPTTAYVFPGQGIQAQGMGMEGYARSPAARAVWDEAERVCRARFGFSLLDVVRANPRELWVHGERVAHPEGVLFLTQFTQVAMAVMAVAQARELEEAGLLVEGARYAGHSLGEYSALAALSGVMPLAGVVDIVYHRGLTMDRLVERDAGGRSPYGMGVVRPHYAGLDEAGAFALVDELRAESGLALEVVNHNVRGRQYSVTGHSAALAALAARLGEGFVPVPGIDVPFHSTILRGGVDAFRATLDAALPSRVDAGALAGRYLPNLTGSPFALDERFFGEVAAACGSPRVDEWRRAVASPAGFDADALARGVLVEVLAWQFASPVRWIEIQERLLAGCDGCEGVEAYVEVGAAHQPTLANMARATLARSSSPRRVRVLHSEVDRALLAGPLEVETDPVERPPAAVVVAAPAAATAKPAVEQAAAAAPTLAPLARAALPAASLVTEGVRTLLALQTKRRPEQLSLHDSLDALLGGNSARRNQVLADLAAELEVRAVDGAHEIPLAKLVELLGEKASGYEGRGAYLAKARATHLGRALGGSGVDEAALERYLLDAWQLEGGHVIVALDRCALAARDGDSTAGGPLSAAPPGKLADKAAALAWVDRVVEAYGRELGVALHKPSSAPASGVSVDAGALHELEERLLGDDGALLRAARAAAAELGLSLRPEPQVDDPATVEARARLALHEREHGEGYDDAIAPRFDAKKHVALTSWWAWGKRDVLALEARARRGELVLAGEAERVARRLDEGGLAIARFLGEQGDARVAEVMRAVREGGKARYLPLFRVTRPVAHVDEQGRVALESEPRTGERTPLDVVARLAPPPELQGALEGLCADGASFEGKTALVTGAGAGSIALDVVRALLSGGARVIVTTSGYSAERVRGFKRLYQEHAGRGAELHVVPANQGSLGDVDELAAWLKSVERERVGSSERTLKQPWVPDLLVPFGALGETASLLELGGRSLASWRVLVLGVERLIARLAELVRDHGRPEQRLHVLLPLSPNHGTFGGDGAYGEHKAALEVLLARWRSEQSAWGRYTTLAGARIGWVRGTGLMQENDALAALLEDEGLRTFSTEEMAMLLVGLCTDDARAAARDRPLLADLTGGLGQVDDLGERLREGRARLEERARERRRLHELSEALTGALGGARGDEGKDLARRARPEVCVPVPTEQDLAELRPLDHLDLSRVVVVAGYGEVGPWGSARTRWDMERDGALSLEGVAELAWLMGLIVPAEGGGFVDSESKKPVRDDELHARYEQRILAHAGVRVTNPDVVGFDPSSLPRMVEVHLERDFAFVVPTLELAEEMRRQDAAGTDVVVDEGRVTVVKKRGSVVRVPAAFKLERRVTGQLPTGWDPARLGIPPELVAQVDPVTLYCLVSTAEAFLSAGLEPEELYRWLHPARVGVTVGTGIGGMKKLHRLHRDHYDGAERQNDTLQETLINVIGGYIVQSYLGSYGAMSFPVGACATAGLSVTEGVERILAGAVDLVVAGGADDLSEAGLVGFRDMGATADTDELLERGVEPRHCSRPSDSRRRGFVEAHGAGALLLCRASLALEVGLPVYGVVAYAGTFGDGLQRSVPAPGQGALACAMERAGERRASDACAFDERRRRVAKLYEQRVALALALGADEADRVIAAGKREHAHDFWRDRDDVSPLRGSLAVLGLVADDVGVVSKHDSSTQANDENEARLHAALAKALGRSEGNPLLVISQKALTGHPKGAAAAWQMNGLLQAMADGALPPNPSLDDVSAEMRRYGELVLTDRPLDVGWGRLKAGLVTTLGFGHVSALVCLAHPYLFWRMLSDDERAGYELKVRKRESRATARLQAVLCGQRPLFVRREERPFAGRYGDVEHAEHEARVLLDASARMAPDGRFA